MHHSNTSPIAFLPDGQTVIIGDIHAGHMTSFAHLPTLKAWLQANPDIKNLVLAGDFIEGKDLLRGYETNIAQRIAELDAILTTMAKEDRHVVLTLGNHGLNDTLHAAYEELAERYDIFHYRTDYKRITPDCLVTHGNLPVVTQAGFGRKIRAGLSGQWRNAFSSHNGTHQHNGMVMLPRSLALGEPGKDDHEVCMHSNETLSRGDTSGLLSLIHAGSAAVGSYVSEDVYTLDRIAPLTVLGTYMTSQEHHAGHGESLIDNSSRFSMASLNRIVIGHFHPNEPKNFDVTADHFTVEALEYAIGLPSADWPEGIVESAEALHLHLQKHGPVTLHVGVSAMRTGLKPPLLQGFSVTIEEGAIHEAPTIIDVPISRRDLPLLQTTHDAQSLQQGHDNQSAL